MWRSAGKVGTRRVHGRQRPAASIAGRSTSTQLAIATSALSAATSSHGQTKPRGHQALEAQPQQHRQVPQVQAVGDRAQAAQRRARQDRRRTGRHRRHHGREAERGRQVAHDVAGHAGALVMPPRVGGTRARRPRRAAPTTPRATGARRWASAAAAMPHAKTGRKVGSVDIAVSGQASATPAALQPRPSADQASARQPPSARAARRARAASRRAGAPRRSSPRPPATTSAGRACRRRPRRSSARRRRRAAAAPRSTS